MLFYNSSMRAFQINWNIKREPIYRLLDKKEYIDNFFEKGELMISCFNNFKKNPDEMQGDTQEGHALVGEFGNGQYNKHVMYDGGLNAFIMSTTTEMSEQVIKDFAAVGAIKINDPTAFALEIAKKLPFVHSGLEGNCSYKSSRVHFLEGESGKILNDLDFQDPSSIEAFKNLTMGMEIFLKLEKYKHQNEYRFAWFSRTDVDNSEIIKVPEAIIHCEKIIF